jgi:hypothetical protein
MSHLSTQQEHAVAEIAELLGDRLELLPVLAGIRGEPFGALPSFVAAPLIGPAKSRPPFEVRGHQFGEHGVDILPVVGVDDLLGELQLVLRHGRRVSRSRSALSYAQG